MHRFSYVEIIGGAVLEVRLWLREVPGGRPVLLERLALAPQGGHVDHDLVALAARTARPGRSTTPCSKQWVHPPPGPPVAPPSSLLAGILNVSLPPLWPSVPPSVDHWLPVRRPPAVGGRRPWWPVWPWCGLARGVRRGFRPVWVATLVLLLATTVDRLVQGTAAEGSIFACLFCLWLLVEHQHFRVSPRGQPAVRLAGRRRSGGHRRHRRGGQSVGEGHRAALRRGVLLVVVAVLIMLLLVALPGRESRRTGAARQEAFERARAIIDQHGGDTLDYFALRDDKSWFFTGESLVAYSVINGVMLVSPDPIGPPEDRAEAWSDVMDLAQSNGWQPSVLAASAVVAARVPGGRDWSTTTSATRPSSTPPRSPSRASR